MDWMSLVTTLIPVLAGPASAVLVCVGVLVFIGYLVIKHILPSVEKRFAESQNTVNSLMVEHKADRDTFHTAIQALTHGQTTITSKLDALVGEVKDLSESMENVVDKIDRLDKDVDDLIIEREHKP